MIRAIYKVGTKITIQVAGVWRDGWSDKNRLEEIRMSAAVREQFDAVIATFFAPQAFTNKWKPLHLRTDFALSSFPTIPLLIYTAAADGAAV